MLGREGLKERFLLEKNQKLWQLMPCTAGARSVRGVEAVAKVLLPFERSPFLRELPHAECQMRITALAAKKTLARQLVNLPRLRQLELKRSVNANC